MPTEHRDFSNVGWMLDEYGYDEQNLSGMGDIYKQVYFFWEFISRYVHLCAQR
jgi:hypothetical protein